MTKNWMYQRRRSALIDDLREKGISEERILEAMGRVARHKFMEDALMSRAYEDEALPIGLKQTISQPFTVAYQSMLLNPEPDEKILEIGTGSGYQAAVLCELGARVFTIERLGPLFDRTAVLLKTLGYRAVTRLGDGTRGWESVAPFDGIIVTAGATDVPKKLLDQLKLPSDGRPGGRLIIPVGGSESQKMLRIRRTGKETFETEELDGFRFVPLVADS
ncbi:MAG: protein-L-isoaspartate(D-aspartate) O-methyltransferase [Bacteroidetes bacterium]|nr:MAG: protein-L-isoaspartate(D-aspartate) O-methyltransferase [Bacteroidota bacterium]